MNRDASALRQVAGRWEEVRAGGISGDLGSNGAGRANGETSMLEFGGIEVEDGEEEAAEWREESRESSRREDADWECECDERMRMGELSYWGWSGRRTGGVRRGDYSFGLSD